MKGITRRRFLSGAAGLGLAGAATAQDGPRGEVTRVPMDVEPTQGWLTWVGATTSCLRALGCDCDSVDVAGMTGYAFMLNIDETVGVWSPTDFRWGILRNGITHLGRAALEFFTYEQSQATYRAAYDVVSREVEAGRPCVINGAFVPEFASVVGVQDGCYHLVGAYGQGPLHCEKLAAFGGVYVLGFPAPTQTEPGAGDELAVNHAVQLLRQTKHSQSPASTCGIAAFDAWITELEAERADSWGNSYCVACYVESRAFAQEFLGRVAARHEGIELLQLAADAYVPTVDAMNRLVELFPFPGKAGETVTDPITIAEAVETLRAARDGEAEALAHLEEAVAAEWGEA